MREYRHSRAWFRGEHHSGAGMMAGFGVLRGLFLSLQFYDSMIVKILSEV